MSTPNTIGIAPGRLWRGFGLLTTADTGSNPRQTPSNSVQLYQLPASTTGTKTGGGKAIAEPAQLINWSVTPLGTTVAGVVVLYLYDGTTYQEIDEFLVAAQTASTTAAMTTGSGARSLAGKLLLPNWQIVATTLVAQSPGLMVDVHVGEY